MDPRLSGVPEGFAHAIGDYLVEVGSNMQKHKETLLVFKDALQSCLKQPEVEISLLTAKGLQKVVDVGRVRKQRKAMHKKRAVLKHVGKADVVGRAETALRLRECALYCFLFEIVRLGKGDLGEDSVLAISEIAKAVGYSLLIFAEVSGPDSPRLQEKSRSMVQWEKTKSSLRAVQYGASVLNAVVTVIGMTSMFSGDSDPLDELQKRSSMVATTLSVTGSAIAVYENRDKIYAVAKGVFTKAYGLVPAGLADSLSKVSAIADEYLLHMG